MANNITITQGSGTTIATDEISNVNYQIIKIADGTEGGTGRIAGDATNGLDVDVTRVIPGTSATHLGKAEDAAHTSGDTGVMLLGVRNDSLEALAGTDGDYTPAQFDSAGALYVNTSQTPLDRLTSNIGVAQQTDTILSDTTAITPKFVIIDAASSGDNTILAAVVGKKIRVLSAVFTAAGALTARFESGASGTALTGQMTLATGTPVVLPFNPLGHFETAENTLLNLELSAGTSVDGVITYIEV